MGSGGAKREGAVTVAIVPRAVLCLAGNLLKHPVDITNN